MQINWDSFIVHNRDSRGVRFKFEDLCRHLFINENLSGNKQFRYLHANPNNPGLETEPIFNEKINKRVGFQAKFFEGNPNYGEIKNSAQKIVKYYSDKVELVYIFCNKPLTTSSLSKTINILKTANIELQLITDAAILDLIINKYPYLGLYYFGNQFINHEWFLRNSEYVFDELGERYNRAFNYETRFFVELSLFVHDQRAADYINQKKAFLLREIEKIYGSELRVRQYLRELKSSIEALPDVNTDNLYDSAQWKARVESAVSVYQDPFRKELTELQKEQEKCNKKLNEAKDKIEYDKVLSKLHSLSQDIKRIESLINLPCGIEISEREKQLMLGAVLTVQGRAGTGKTQLLAYKTKQLLSSGRNALLLNAGDYYSTNPIREQIIKNLGFDYSFDELIDDLETIGENGNYIVPLFIDAINETWNRNLWKTELPRIIEKVKRNTRGRLNTRGRFICTLYIYCIFTNTDL